jgi:hypothetical protein
MKSNIFFFLTILQLGWAQDIVLKATFPAPNPVDLQSYELTADFTVDINEDGVTEIPVVSNGFIVSFLDRITMTVKRTPQDLGIRPDGAGAELAIMRNVGRAEVVGALGDNIYVYDIALGTLLATLPSGRSFVFDYDLDGLDDVLILINNTLTVYGIATGNPPISPPQELDIIQVGEDYVITWDSVPTATAYRIEWSSALDGGVRFTRIGYTTSTTFTHRNQADQAQGYYRVMSEDNGTGVVRLVGASR